MKKGRVYEFQDKLKVDFMGFWHQKRSFPTQEVGRKMIFAQYFLRNGEGGASAP